MKYPTNSKIIYLFTFFIVKCSYGSLRGIDPNNKDHYLLQSDFKCLDGSKSIPINQINDDYCDCPDGSDEPGTAACPNGVFYCLNEGYRPTILPSNRVLDGVCDCCDGSDEYNGEIQCENTCNELGRQLRADEEKKYATFLAGNEVYKQYCQEGTAAKEEQKAKLVTLGSEKEKLEAEKADQDSIVKNLEGPENEAKEKFKQAWEEGRRRRKEERDKNKALEVFHQLDIDSDGRVSLEELKKEPELDTNADGEVSEEETKEHMGGEEESVQFDVFFDRVWKRIEPLLKQKAKQEETTPSAPYEEDDEDDKKGGEEEDEEEDVDADNDEEEEEEEEGDQKGNKEEEEEEEHMPPYDQDTQKYIDVAEAAREVYRHLDQKLNNVNNDISHANKVLESDYGVNNEFYSLASVCVELSDREYTYKLCPFDRSSQRNKQGGSETSLGHWGRWEDSSYSTMLFERGQNCWNGPDRSTKVSLECGPENALLSAEEPSRCEYHFVLSTPAACSRSPHHETTPRSEL